MPDDPVERPKSMATAKMIISNAVIAMMRCSCCPSVSGDLFMGCPGKKGGMNEPCQHGEPFHNTGGWAIKDV